MKYFLHAALAGCLVFLADTCLKAQQYIGLMNQQYAGVHRLYLNPAEVAAGKTKMSYNTVSTGFTFQNNYAHWAGEEAFVTTLLSGEGILEGFAPNGNALNTFGFETEMRGPAGMLHLGPLFGAGISTRVRSDIQVHDASLNLLEMARLGIDDPAFAGKAFTNQQFHFRNLGITEIALSLGAKIPIAGKHSLYAGASIKRLLSFSSTGLHLNSIDYAVEQIDGKDVVTIQRLAGSLNYSRPNIQGFSLDNIFGNIPGKGWGADVGVLYQLSGDNMERPLDISVGMALLDIGSIRFDGELARRYTFSRTEPLTIDDFSALSDDPVNGLKEVLNLEETQGEPNYQLKLPATMSFQADISFMKKFGVSGLLRYPAKESETSGPSGYAGIIPRFELRKFGVSVPVMLMQDFQTTTIGTTFRLGPWFIGSDNLLSALSNSNIDHFNYYTGFSFNLGGDSWTD